MKIKRVYHHFEKCEEFKSSMYKNIKGNKEEAIKQTVAFMADSNKFAAAMLKVTQEWPYSCEANLTINSSNQAWLGQAACALEINIPEDITRLAWKGLSEDQQNKANAAADKAIEQWKAKHAITIKELNRASMDYYKLLGPIFGDRKIAAAIGINVYDDSDKTFYAAFQKDQLIGLCSVRGKVVSDCYVMADKRKKGVLTSILNFALKPEIKYRATCTPLSVNVFKNLGFTEIKQLKNFTVMECA